MAKQICVYRKIGEGIIEVKEIESLKRVEYRRLDYVYGANTSSTTRRRMGDYDVWRTKIEPVSLGATVLIRSQGATGSVFVVLLVYDGKEWRRCDIAVGGEVE